MKKNLNSILKAAVVIAVALAMIVPASAMNSNTNTISGKKYTNDTTTMNREVIFQDSFETYEDFIVDNFPPWTTYDGDGGSTWGMEGYDWPNAYYIGSFIIFKQTLITPTLGA